MKTPLRDRVLGRLIIDPSGCLLWPGSTNGQGYGEVRDCRKKHYVHRLMYEWFVAPIPAGMQLDHLCRVHNCASPAHLEPVTAKENARRGFWGARTHCLRSHEFTEANTYFRKDNGTRQCRACSRIRSERRLTIAEDMALYREIERQAMQP